MKVPRDQGQRFANLLTHALHRIATSEAKSITQVELELATALGRSSRSYIGYLRKGNIPTDDRSKELLAAEIFQRSDCSVIWIQEFLSLMQYSTRKMDGFIQHLTSSLETSANRAQPARELGLPDTDNAQQPFVVGPPVLSPHAFFGRQSELQRIFSCLEYEPLQPIAIVGKRRSGKTSLLHYLRTITTATVLRPGQRQNWLPHPGRFSWVFVDFQDARIHSSAGFFKYILSALDIAPPDPCNLTTFVDIMIQKLTGPTMLLLDEFNAALSLPEFDHGFWGGMRSLICNYTAGKLGVLVAAHASPLQLAREHGEDSPFFNIFGNTITLGPLTDQAAHELINSSPLPFASADIDWILSTSGRWPILLQILCRERLLALRYPDLENEWQVNGLQQIAPFRYLLQS